jgi:hypothetical protein
MCQLLFVFDFDDTLCSTNTVIKVINNRTHECFDLSTHQWRHHKIDHELYTYDWTQFQCLDSSYKPIKQTLDYIKEIYDAYGHMSLYILTARGSPKGPQEFLKIFNLDNIEVIALGIKADKSSGKADWIRQQIIERDIRYVAYFEDNINYINEVKKLQKEFPKVIFNIQHVIA